jgi:sugar lactone lactonase YvrE
MDALQEPLGDGFLFCFVRGVARIVADGLWFANGVAVDADETHVYVAETMRARVTRFAIRTDGSLGSAEQYGPELGAAPDGIAFDEAGNLWVTLPGTNGLGIVAPDRSWRVVVEDPSGKVLHFPTNICFGGPDRRTAYIGNLMQSSLPTFRVPHPGMPLVHQL